MLHMWAQKGGLLGPSSSQPAFPTKLPTEVTGLARCLLLTPHPLFSAYIKRGGREYLLASRAVMLSLILDLGDSLLPPHKSTHTERLSFPVFFGRTVGALGILTSRLCASSVACITVCES